MTPLELEATLEQFINTHLKRSLMIWGPPGIGKSSIVAQAAAAAKLELIDLRLSQLAPTDLRGLPVPDGEVARWLPPEFLPAKGKGILFLDEINLAPPAVQGIAQQLILDRRVGSYCVPEGWHLWAAGNRKEDRAAVFDMPAPLANRFLHYDVAPDFESWRRWAVAREVHEQVLAFLAFRPSLLHQPDRNSPAWPSCRTWEMAGELHAAGLSTAAAVGEGAEGEFEAFLKVYTDLPDLEAILKGKGTKESFGKEPSLRFATTVGLSFRAGKGDTLVHGFQWLIERAGAEWVQLYLHNAWERVEANGQVGRLAALLQTEPRMKDFLEKYRAALARN